MQKYFAGKNEKLQKFTEILLAKIVCFMDKMFENGKVESWLVVLLFYVHGKHLRSCRDGQLT